MSQLYLNKLDKQVLFTKYVKEGLNGDEADFRVKKICLHLRGLVLKLKDKNKSKEDIHRRFLEEFNRLREQY